MPSYGQDTTAVVSNFAQRDTNRILPPLYKSLATRSVWTNCIKGGVFPSGMGDQLRTVVQLPAITVGLNYAAPTLTDFTAMCGLAGNQTKYSTTTYLTKLQGLRGQGPSICVSQGYGAYKEGFNNALDSLVKDTRLIRDAIDRSQMYGMSGTKYTALSTAAFANRIAGGTELSLGVAPIATAPDSQISFQATRKLATFLKEELFAEAYTMKIAETGVYDHFCLFVGSQSVIDNFRTETAVQTSLIALTTGGFKYGEKALSGMNYQTAGAWQGIAMAADQFPLRYNDLGDGTTGPLGQPIFINPFVEVVDDSGNNLSHRAPNPAYRTATNEIAFLLFESAVERLVPERYTGEGSTKFDPRLGNGEIKWHYVQDNTLNTWGDFGFHKYEFIQAFRAIRPQHLVTLHYKRCDSNDLIICS